MKTLFLKVLLPILFMSVPIVLRAQYQYLNGTFEAGFENGWSVEPQASHDKWEAKDGWMTFLGEQSGSRSMLLTPELDLSKASKPILKFDYLLSQFDGFVDTFAVYVRSEAESAWRLLYKDSVHQKQIKSIQLTLPDDVFEKGVQIAFECVNMGGNGVRLDNVVLYEDNVCVNPPKELRLLNLSHSTAVITWLTDAKAAKTRVRISRQRISSPDEAEVSAWL